MLEFFDIRGRPVRWSGEEVKIRIAGYALIERVVPIERHDILMIRVRQTEFLELPGGGLEPGRETLSEAVIRECLEEIGCKVQVDGRSFFQQDRGFWHVDAVVNGFYHASCHWFLASTRQIPVVPEGNGETTDIVWLGLHEILPRMQEINPVHRAALRALVADRYDARGRSVDPEGQLTLPVG